MFFVKRKRKVIQVEGMSCEHCAKKVQRALESLVDVSKAQVNLKKKEAFVFYENSVDELLLKKTIEDLGYIVTGIKEVR